MRRQSRDPESGAARAIAACDEAREHPDEHRESGYRGASFAALVSSCALAYQITGRLEHAELGLRYLEALLEDEHRIGDGAGGDAVVRRDSGYPIRYRGPYAALGYDWLHGAPGSRRVLDLARARFRAWTDWYRRSGYLRDTVGANYHAGWFFAAALIAVAQAGEAGEDGRDLWRHVSDDMASELAAAMGEGGVLRGGDWPEGWQYGPLAVLEYSLGARALGAGGVEIPGIERWHESLLRRHVHALDPTRTRSFIGGDADISTSYQRPSALPLLAVVAGEATPKVRSWARAELASLELREDERFPVFRALAEARPGPARPFPRTPEQTALLARGTGHFYARSSWERDAIWMVTSCAAPPVPDHYHYDAGNFVLTRGADPLVVDPSPYGSMSSLTSNAPTVDSPQLPKHYRPSQGPWGKETGFSFAGQTESGVVVARCDYADQYRFQQRASDVERAERDLVLLPRGGSAALVVWDRAKTGRERGTLHLRFRTPGSLQAFSGGARARLGESILSIRRAKGRRARQAVRPMAGEGECWDVPRGRCRLSRIAGDELAVELRGAEPEGIHLVEALSAKKKRPASAAALLGGAGYRGLAADTASGRLAVILNEQPGAHSILAWAPLVYTGPRDAVHVILDPPGGAGQRVVRARRVDGGCAVAVGAAGGEEVAGPALVLRLSQGCRPAVDAFRGAGSERRKRESSRAGRPRRGSGTRATTCAACGGGRAGGGGVAALVLGVFLLRRRPGARRAGGQGP